MKHRPTLYYKVSTEQIKNFSRVEYKRNFNSEYS